MSATTTLAPDAAPRRSLAWANRGLTAIIAGLVAILLLGIALRALGLTTLVDYTDSMRPAISAGDIVVDRSVRVADLRPGQIASIADPGQGGRLITHRVVSVTRTGDRVTVITRGDANNAAERWVLPAGASVKRMTARVPWLGHIVVWLASPLLRSLLLLLGALLVGAYGVSRLRRKD
ncbi:MAG: peptidase signal peptidase [Solirubrobacteraceae bacterium]|nr:peptidase signal peptidase [Solirubrobacteraceae bacterium]